MSDALESPTPRPKLFVSYAHADETNDGWKAKLLPTLQALRIGGIVDFFEDEMIAVGDEWDERLRRELDAYDLIIFLVSTSFLASRYIETVEVKRAMERHNARDAHVLPILVRDCDWTYRNWARIQTFPRHGPDVLALAEWEKRGDLDKALTQLSVEIRGWAAGWKPRHGTSSATGALPSTPPYRGLLAFQEEHKDDFFGRDDLLETLRATVRDNRLTLLRGGSGSGKSSLINAGLLPSLKAEERWCIARLRPGETPIVNVANALARAMLPGNDPFAITDKADDLAAKLAQNPARLLKYATTHAELSGKALFLVVDQLEESFNLALPANPEQHRQLMMILRSIADAIGEPVVKALLGMRADFQVELQNEDPLLVKALDRATVSMTRMTDAEFALSIQAPAQRRGVSVEPAMLARIVKDVARNPDALPLVEVTLETLWVGRRSNTLTLDAYEKQGGLAGALGSRGEAALADPAIDEQRARRLFLQLVHVDPKGGIDSVTRQPRTRVHLDGLDPALWELGRTLASAAHRLLVTSRDDATGTETLDIIHESLFRQWPRLRGWIEDERDFLLFAQRVDHRLAEFTASGENPDYLLPRTDAEAARAWQQEQSKVFRADHKAFIDYSLGSWAERDAEKVASDLWGQLELSFAEQGEALPNHEEIALNEILNLRPRERHRFLSMAISERHLATRFLRQIAMVSRALIGINIAESATLFLPVLKGCPVSGDLERQCAWLHIAGMLAPAAPELGCHIIQRLPSLDAALNHPETRKPPFHVIGSMVDDLTEKQLQTLLAWTISMLPRAIEFGYPTLISLLPVLAVKAKIEKYGALTKSICAAVANLSGFHSQRSEPIVRAIQVISSCISTEDATNISKEFMPSLRSADSPGQFASLVMLLDCVVQRADAETCRAFEDVVSRCLTKWLSAQYNLGIFTVLNVIPRHFFNSDSISYMNSKVIDQLLMLEQSDNDRSFINAANHLSLMIDNFSEVSAVRSISDQAIEKILDLVARRGDKEVCDLLQKLTKAIGLNRVQDAFRRSRVCSKDIFVSGYAGRSEIDLHILATFSRLLGSEQIRMNIKKVLDSIEGDIFFIRDQRSLVDLEIVVARLGQTDFEVLFEKLINIVERYKAMRPIDSLCPVVSSFVKGICSFGKSKVIDMLLARTLMVALESDSPEGLKLIISIIGEKNLRDFDSETGTKLEAFAERILHYLATHRLYEVRYRENIDEFMQLLRCFGGAALVFSAVELLKLPSMGSDSATAAIVLALMDELEMPRLDSISIERSFYAVMRRLAELKAARPGSEWLDLARAPLPPNELASTFRRLYAAPPDWAAPSAPS